MSGAHTHTCLAVFALAALLLLGGAGEASARKHDEERRNAWILTRVQTPRAIQAEELRLRDVDTGTLHTAGAQGLILLRVKEGRYRFKTLKVVLPDGSEPKFTQPERALKVHADTGWVNYLGDVVLTSRRDGHRLVIEPNANTVLAALSKYPDFFATRRVRVVLGDQKPYHMVFDPESIPGLASIHTPRSSREVEVQDAGAGETSSASDAAPAADAAQ